MVQCSIYLLFCRNLAAMANLDRTRHSMNASPVEEMVLHVMLSKEPKILCLTEVYNIFFLITWFPLLLLVSYLFSFRCIYTNM